MATAQKTISTIPYDRCPFCFEQDGLMITEGKKILFGKKPDSITCSACESRFEVSEGNSSILPKEVGSPYAYFMDSFQKWSTYNKVSEIAQLIRENSPKALDYLSGALYYLWKVRIILDGKGDAYYGGMDLSIPVENEPKSKEQAKKETSRLIQVQKEIRQVKKEMAFDMKEIRAKYGKKSEYQDAKKAELNPFERGLLSIDEIIIAIDRTKLEIQNWVDDNL